MKNLQLELKEFKPFLPFWTGHSQTILGHIIASEPLFKKFQPEVLKLADGDELLIEWSVGTQPYTLSLYHGLGGDAQADYIRRSANIAAELGWNIVLVNHRNATDKVSAQKSYHSGRGHDAEAVIEWSRQKFPNTKQVALGFSMSGSILLNLLSRRYGEKQPDFAIVVNAPLDLGKSAQLLTRGFSKVYDYRFYRLLKKIIVKKENIKLPLIGRTMDIDKVYTGKFNGFKNAQDYYDQCSVRDHVGNITTPVFVLTAEDDPFVDVNDYQTAVWPASVNLTIKSFGGHMGYFSKNADPKYGRRWLDTYLRSVFEKIQII